ncbi:trehalose-6-phosphate phosphatase OtsB1 [Mycobacterium intracellulare subsp. chimaera]|uniref:Trehalose-6-phosphate phosphatase OtsB1 n=1 Tax=Mycobacterium intracellulare subsp. chimaera TaxID=222805 RepID=A0A7U5MKE1_MYCIT|nr:trehalose-phosphatase [Mycobacterium intracellulare]ASL15166.1 trehalose-6-phosphate phosphatase OtsB1 [Mycobacterium intracellulare subsp. chimaera]MCF1815947.1 trehalose-phosphatase [Mycobacterium intracellulare subsp. intracellulare]MDM3929456.1 trehalose-phosphatase [Mycobacterium intracellulare subsp. chimaera]MDS0337855.1 trehalose-phosphatase [Mycobacterium intracellulare]
MTEWPATLDRRYHDAVIFDLACVVTETAPETTKAGDSTALLLRRLRDVGFPTAVYSRIPGCGQVLRSVGIHGSVDVVIDAATDGNLDSASLAVAAARMGVRAARCVVVEPDQAGVKAAVEGGFGLVIGLENHGDDGELLVSGADTVVADLAEISVRTGGTAMSQIADAVEGYSQLRELVVARRPAVFLDFDGTLSDIVDHPESATLVDGAADALRALATQCPVAVISGRDLSDVRERVNVERVWYAGSHGFDLLEPNGTRHENASAAVIDALGLAATRLAGMFKGVSGIELEHKRFAVAIHYRNADPQAEARVVATVRQYGRSEGFRASLGRKVIELRPNVAWNKGTTLDWLLAHIDDRVGGSPAVLPIYIGDDLTDEDAFDAVQFDGVAIVVRHAEDGDRPSAARFSLESPSAVCGFIRRLADDLEEISAAPTDSWELVYDDYRPDHERLREALCTVGNGYVATRGCAPEAPACEVHYPGTYAAGVYNRLGDRIAGRSVENESLVNLPNWLSLTFRINDGPWFRVDDVELVSFRQVFDLRHATLTRTLRFVDGAGHRTTLTQLRFASMHQPHIVAMMTTITADNWSGTIDFRSLLDGGMRNTLVARYRSLSDTHLTNTVIEQISPDSVLLQTATSQSRIAIAVAARSTVWRDDVPVEARYKAVHDGNRGGHDIRVAVSAGQSITLEKIATIVTGRDAAISEPTSAARHYLEEAGRYADLHHQHARAWARLWEQCAVNLDDDTEALRILRLHLVHLLQTISPHTAELDVGVPARGLHGEAYRGHVFWDSLFISPVLSVRMPNVARSLLLYRYRRLPEACRAARRAGYVGAMYPWQSGSDGREVSQQLHLNPQSGRWNPDPSARAHHVGLAVAFNAWQHYQVTGDRQYLVDYGAELMVEIARFWVGLAKFDSSHDRYTIRGIIGPDEFHYGYPGREYDGIDNNAYTNVMTVWVILRAMDALDLLPLRDRLDLVGRLGLTAQELDRWEHVTRRMFVPFHDGVISQFEGYPDLAELDWEQYRQRYGNIQRLDRILEAEDDSVNDYKVSKQADALMLFYLLSSEELLGLFGRLGYSFAAEQIPRTVDYYLARTSHGSTLSAVVHSWVLARANRHMAIEYFDRVLQSDIADIQGGTTSEGIHLAAMAGSIDLLQRCFTGLETRNDRLILNPLWPEILGPMEFAIVYRGQRLHLRIRGRAATVTSEAGKAQPIGVECRGRVQPLLPGQTIDVG